LNVRDEISHLVEFAHGQLAICRDLESVNTEILMELVEKIVNKSLSPEQFELIGGVSILIYSTTHPHHHRPLHSLDQFEVTAQYE